ncbi:MAG TPA: hypothetical protein VMA53_28440 [Stellaceae bacterium]|nr:hypothetical protein [Stellaceae bacterium]
MDELQQVHSVAAMLVEKHGVRAVSVAEYNALKAQHGGDTASANGWRSVARAAAALMGDDTGLDH